MATLRRSFSEGSIDEALVGHCSEIKVQLNADGSCSIHDDGRGIPVDMHPKYNMPALELVLTNLHAGGSLEKVHIRFLVDCMVLGQSALMRFQFGSLQR